MADPFVAEIRIFGFNFAPVGWALCDGQILPIAQNTALFSLLGTTYGGDGKTNFALPDLQGRAPMHPDQGPGLSPHSLGESSGAETVTLLASELPLHAHAGTSNLASTAAANSTSPANRQLGTSDRLYNPPGPPSTTMSPAALGPSGGNLPHNNLQPYLTLNFCIALQGIFPPRS